MEKEVLTRQYLETLSNDELFSLADDIGLDIPPFLNRIFIIEEVLEASADEGEEEIESTDLVIDEELEPVEAIPSLYFATYLHVLLRDPYWAYVFWEIRSTERVEMEKEEGFEGYCLHIWNLEDSNTAINEKSFTISLSNEDSAWYVGLPATATCYRVDLCLLNGGREQVLASSGSFYVPALPAPEEQEEKVRELAELCGVASIQVMRAKERVLNPRSFPVR